MTDPKPLVPLVIRYMRVDELIPYIRNPRKHPEKQVAALAALIGRVGFGYRF